jgi:hypothetical protein
VTNRKIAPVSQNMGIADSVGSFIAGEISADPTRTAITKIYSTNLPGFLRNSRRLFFMLFIII